MPNRKVTPTRVTNMELENPLTMALAERFPAIPSRKAAPTEKKPMLIFLMNPTATTRASTSREITLKSISILLFLLYQTRTRARPSNSRLAVRYPKVSRISGTVPFSFQSTPQGRIPPG